MRFFIISTFLFIVTSCASMVSDKKKGKPPFKEGQSFNLVLAEGEAKGTGRFYYDPSFLKSDILTKQTKGGTEVKVRYEVAESQREGLNPGKVCYSSGRYSQCENDYGRKGIPGGFVIPYKMVVAKAVVRKVECTRKDDSYLLGGLITIKGAYCGQYFVDTRIDRLHPNYKKSIHSYFKSKFYKSAKEYVEAQIGRQRARNNSIAKARRLNPKETKRCDEVSKELLSNFKRFRELAFEGSVIRKKIKEKKVESLVKVFGICRAKGLIKEEQFSEFYGEFLQAAENGELR